MESAVRVAARIVKSRLFGLTGLLVAVTGLVEPGAAGATELAWGGMCAAAAHVFSGGG